MFLILLLLFFAVLWVWWLDSKRQLLVVFLASVLVQVLISIGLYYVSLHPPKEIQKEVLAPGFWGAFGDARLYFMQSQALIKAEPLPGPLIPASRLFIFFLSTLGRFTSCPVIAAVGLNGLFHLLLIPLCFLLFKKILGSQASLWISAGVASLPSGYLFSSQVLRDPLIWLVVMVAVGLCLNLQRENALFNSPLGKIFGFTSLLACATFLSEMRHWLGCTLVVAAVLSFLVMQRQWLRWRELVVTAVILSGVIIGVKNPLFHLLGDGKDPERQPSQDINENQIDSRKVDRAHSKENPWLKITFFDQAKKNYHLAKHRVTSKFSQGRQKIPTIFYFCSALDFIGLATWAYSFRSCIKKGILKNPKSDKKTRFFLGSLVCLEILVPLLYADSLGNFSRYIFPALMTLILLISAQSLAKFYENPVNMGQKT